MHIQNLIVHNQLPYLIDLEFSFQPHVNSIEGIGCLALDTGAMTVSAAQTRWRHLYDMNGLQTGNIPIPEKNRLYVRTAIKKLEPCPLNKASLKSGFSEAMKILHQKNEKFLLWLNNFKDLKIRIILFATSSLRNQADVLAECLTDEMVTEKLIAFRKSAVELWLDELMSEENKAQSGLYHFVPPRFAAMSLAHINRDYQSRSLPVFYMKINSMQLLNAYAEPIQINYNEIKEHAERRYGRQSAEYEEVLRVLKALNLVETTDDYFQATPFSVTESFMRSLSDEYKFNQVIEEANHFFDESLVEYSHVLMHDDPGRATSSAASNTNDTSNNSSHFSSPGISGNIT